MLTESQKKAQKKYGESLSTIIIRLHKEKDGDIIAKIRSQPCMTSYIRGLVQNDMSSGA